jgi:hypothetical protein
MQRHVVGVDGRKYSTTVPHKPKEPEIVQELKSLKERFNLDFNKIEEELRRLKEQDENVSKKMQSAKELQAKVSGPLPRDRSPPPLLRKQQQAPSPAPSPAPLLLLPQPQQNLQQMAQRAQTQRSAAPPSGEKSLRERGSEKAGASIPNSSRERELAVQATSHKKTQSSAPSILKIRYNVWLP